MRSVLCLAVLVAGCGGAVGTTSKSPHLIVAATGEDLGFHTEGNCYFSTALDEEVCFERLSYYVEPVCGGAPILPGEVRAGQFVVLDSGKRYKTGAAGVVKVDTGRVSGLGGMCWSIGSMMVTTALAESGAAKFYPPSELSIELR